MLRAPSLKLTALKCFPCYQVGQQQGVELEAFILLLGRGIGSGNYTMTRAWPMLQAEYLSH